jgi:hypothetical protein
MTKSNRILVIIVIDYIYEYEVSCSLFWIVLENDNLTCEFLETGLLGLHISLIKMTFHLYSGFHLCTAKVHSANMHIAHLVKDFMKSSSD